MHREPKLARRLLDRFEPVHGVTYFAPEAREALDGLGYKGYWMGYFRRALGAAGPGGTRGGDGDLLQLRPHAGRQGITGGLADRRSRRGTAGPAGHSLSQSCAATVSKQTEVSPPQRNC